MSLSSSLGDTVKSAPAGRTMLQKIELACFLFLALNQVVGMLDPPEAFFFDPQAYSQDVGGGGGGRPYPLTTAISHFSEAFALFLVLRHWRDYLGIIKRSSLVFFQVLLIIGSTMWSISPTDSMRSSTHYIIDYILALHIVYSYSAFGFASLFVRLSAIGVATSFLFLAAFPGISHEVAVGAYSSAWRGAYENKNFLGAITSISMVVSGYSILTGANDRRFASIVMFADLALLLGSRSSTGLVATGICLAILCLVGGTRNPRAGIVMAAVGLAGIFFFSAALMSVHDPFALLGKDSTLTGRTSVWHAVIPLIHQRPLFGYGLGFWDIDSDFRNDVWAAANWQAPHAHNDYLDIALQTGIVCLCVVLVNYAICLYRGVRSMWQVNEGSVLYLMLIINFMIRGLTETLTTSPSTPQIALLYVAETYLWLFTYRPRSSQAVQIPGNQRSLEWPGIRRRQPADNLNAVSGAGSPAKS